MEKFDVAAGVDAGDAGLVCAAVQVGSVRVFAYQYVEGAAPLPVVVLDIDHDDPETELRVYVNDRPLGECASAARPRTENTRPE